MCPRNSPLHLINGHPATAMATLVNVSTMQLANNLFKSEISPKNHWPSREEHSSNALSFSRYLHHVGHGLSTALNIMDHRAAVDCRDMEWICAALRICKMTH